MRRPPPTVAFALALTLLAGAARAQTGDARAALREGVALRAQGQDEAALAAFRRAWEIARSPRALAQMALAEQSLGRWVEAEEHLREALAADAHPWIRRHRAALRAALDVIAGHVGSLDVRGGVAGAEVRVEGEARGTLPLVLPLQVPVGDVVLEVRAPGYLPYQRQVTVRRGEMAREEVRLVAVAAAPTTPPPSLRPVAAIVAPRPPPPPRPLAGASSTQRTLGWVGVGGALAVIGAGLAALAVREDLVATYNAPGCRRDGQTRERNCRALRDDAGTAGTLAVAGLIGGGALAVTSLVVLLTASPREARAVAVRCGRGPGDWGVTCGAAF